MPVAVLLSYPAIFLVPAVSLAMAIELCLQRHAAAVAGVAGSERARGRRGGGAILRFRPSPNRGRRPAQRNAFAAAFPPLHSAKQLAMFLLESHTGEAFAYPAGGGRGAVR